jgi:hypothetical protein
MSRIGHAAAKAFVLYDPAERMDAMHAALFTRSNVTKFRLRQMGDALQTELLDLGLLYTLIEDAAEGTLDVQRFATHFRARRSHPAYLRNLLTELDAQSRPYLATLLCRNTVARLNAPRIQRRLEMLEKAAEEGKFRAPPRAAD